MARGHYVGNNPNVTIPRGYEVVDGFLRKKRTGLSKYPWALPALALAPVAPGLMAGMGAGGGGSLSSLAGSQALGMQGLPTAASSLAGGTAAAVGGGAAGAGGGAFAGLSDPISLAILGGSTLLDYFASRNAQKTAKEAAQVQQQGVDRAITAYQEAQQNALKFQEQMWQQQQAQMQPYVSMGHNALGTLSNLMGMPSLSGGGGIDPATGRQLQGGAPMPQGGTLAMMGRPGGSYTAPQMVMMESPDGKERRAVPQTMVAHYQARGGRVIG